MRIAFLADIHGNPFALEAVLADCRTFGVEGYVFLGDLVMIGSRPREVFQTLEALKPLAWIKGNTDGWFEEIQPGSIPSSPQEAEILGLFEYGARQIDDAMRSALISKPVSQVLYLGDAPVMICHGDSLSYSQGIRPDMAGEKLDACLQSGSFSELICGHTHIPMNFVHRGVRFLNFGSVSTPTEGGHHASYGILDLSARRDMRFRQIPFDLEPYARDMKQTGFPGMERVLRRYAGQA